MKPNKMVNGEMMSLNDDDMAALKVREEDYKKELEQLALTKCLRDREGAALEPYYLFMMLYEAMVSGEIPVAKAFYTACKQVIDKYPELDKGLDVAAVAADVQE